MLSSKRTVSVKMVGALTLIALTLASCSSSPSKPKASGATSTTAGPTTTTAATSTTAGAGGSSTTAAAQSGQWPPSPAGTFGVKPTVVVPKVAPPTSLVSMDLIQGTGPTAQAGDQVVVNYVGVSYSTGKQFDASFDRNQPFPFTLGQGQVIPGWDQGVVGMKVGGRRELIIPPNLAYGASGNQVIAPNETLIFIVDLISVNGNSTGAAKG